MIQDEKKDENKRDFPKRKTIVLSIIFFITGLILCKNQLFYSYIQIDEYSIADIAYELYEIHEENCIPRVDYSEIGITNIFNTINEVDLVFDGELIEDTTFLVYYSNNEYSDKFLKQVDVRKGFEHTIKIKFQSINVESIKIIPVGINSTNRVSIPKGKIVLRQRVRNILQKNKRYIFSVLIIICISLGLSFLIASDGEQNNTTNTKKSVRNSNIELLRVISMFVIVLHHYVVHGGAANVEAGANKLITFFLLPGGKICFDAFIAISMWFLVDQQFKISRFINVWLQVLFYSVVFTVVAYLCGGIVDVKEFVSCLLPIAGNSHGFAATYLLFYLIYPFLQKLLMSLNKDEMIRLVWITVYAQLLSQIIGLINDYTQNFASEIGLFIMCYIIMFYLKKWRPAFVSDWKFNLGLFTFAWLASFQAQCMNYIWGNGNTFSKWILNLNKDESSIIMLIGGFGLFFFVNNLKIKQNNIINKIASVSFGVLLIHDHNFFGNIFWHDFVVVEDMYFSSFYIFRVMFMAICIYVACGTIEYVRNYFYERFIVNKTNNSCIIKRIGELNENAK